MATPVRIVTPGRRIHLVIRAVSRQFRFLPKKDVVASIDYIFWYCVEKYGMAIHDGLWMSNHGHICLTDKRGVLPRFVCTFNSMLSRQLNTLRAEEGTNIEKGYSAIEVLDDDAMLDFCSYTLANPCKTDLVSTAKAWKGFSTYKLDYNRPFVVERPNCGIWKDGSPPKPEPIPKTFRPKIQMSKGAASTRKEDADHEKEIYKKMSQLPEKVTAVLVRPDIFPERSDQALREKIRIETQLREEKAAKARHKAGKKVLGWRKVTDAKWTDSPSTVRPLFRKKPRVAARHQTLILQRLEEIAAFNERYKLEREKYIRLGKEHALFPYGTWKMRVQFLANCEPRPPT